MPQIHKKIQKRPRAKAGSLYDKTPNPDYKKWTFSNFLERVHW